MPENRPLPHLPTMPPWRRPSLPALCAVALLWTGVPAPVLAELGVARGSSASAQAVAGGHSSDWVYTLRSGETFGGVARELLRSDASARQLASYNQIRSAASPGAGDHIRIPLVWLRQQPEPARVSGLSGHVQIRGASTGSLRRLANDDPVHAGDTIITRDGMVTVNLADGSTLRINPASTVVFNRLTRYGRNGMTDTRIRLERGALHNRVTPIIEGGARFEVETPSAVAAVRGTAFALQADEQGTHLQVTEGSVAFGRPGNTRHVPAGYGASVDPSARSALQIHRLPPAPEVGESPGTLTRLPRELSWQASGAGRYQVDILDQESGHRVHSEQTHRERIILRDLANGDYRAEIAALSRRGAPGMPASIPFQVDLAARAAELVEPVAGAILNSDRPGFHWRYRGEGERARVEIAREPAFTDVVSSSGWSKQQSATPSRALTAGEYYWRVVTEAGGTSVATSEPRTLVINSTMPPVRVVNVSYEDRQVRIFWGAVKEASGYLLQLSEDPSFADVVKEATVEDTAAALRLIPGRRYFVRLRAVSEGPMVSRWGPGRELYVE